MSDPNSSKYVFRGLGCFSIAPQIIADDDYKTKQISFFESDIRIFVYNIDKFNKEDANMRRVNEIIGDSFYAYLTSLPDLVLIMDESHHYRAERGAAALNELHPLLGLELTATPLVTKGNKQVPFKNVVYEYPLSKAIEDGYTRTPFAVTRFDIDFYNFGNMTTEEFIDYIEERTYPFTFLENGRVQLSELFRKYPESLLLECIDIGIKQYFKYENGKLTQASVSEFINKLGGIAYNKSRSPIDQELYCCYDASPVRRIVGIVLSEPWHRI